jgi:uncharacterized membrane protein YqjE
MSLFGSSLSQPRIPPLGETANLLNDALTHRAELVTLEIDEARSHAQTSALLLGVSMVLALLGGFAVTLTLAVLVWDNPHRGWWLAALCAAYLVGAAGAAWALRNRLKTWRPFAEIRTQIKEDHQCLIQLIKAIVPP